MRVSVSFFGLFKRYVGESRRELELPEGATAGELLAMVGDEYGDRLPRDLWDAGARRFHRTVRLSRQGRPHIGEGEPLADGEELLLLFTMAGG